MTTECLVKLIQDLTEGIITPADLQRLEAELMQNPEAMQVYLTWMDLDNLLQIETSVRKHARTQVIPMERIIHRQRRKMLRTASLSAAALVIIGLAILALFHIPENAASSLTFRTSPGTHFTLTHDASDETTPAGMVMKEGSRLSLSQGTVELTFESGVSSIVMAPAEMTLQSGNKLKLNHGSAWFHVPEGAEGFQVSTQDLEIIDLGTEFGVHADPDNYDEVHVLKGKVKVTTKRVRKESAILSFGESRRIDSIGRLKEIPPAPETFLTSLPDTLPYIHWSFDKVENDAFQAQGNHPDLELSSARPKKADLQPLISKGRFGSAVHFTGVKGQQLQTQLPGIAGAEPRSVACWIRTDYAPDKGTDIASLIGWGYCQSDSKDTPENTIWTLKIGLGGYPLIVGGPHHVGTTNLADGQWHHLACVMHPPETKDGPTRHTLYIDGKIESTRTTFNTEQTKTLTDHPLSTRVRIGASIHRPDTPPIVFRGDIDEVYLFYGALDEATILNLYQSNRPLVAPNPLSTK
ncbi:hypothetical protein Rhal01_01268 [Rubritalea halochordaticola]|uniref:FecR protein domain-containing protein n=1 Tax=Rubritalea halochordaticola TaxID=714537 RepID=A0ABP9V1X8_9BACT